MNTFPTISTSPKMEGFIDEYSDEAVKMADPRNGYPLIIPQFDFDPKTFIYVLRYVSQIDKDAIMVFYQANKEITLLWLNEQNGITYEVVFAAVPHCRLDDEKDEWRIELEFMKAAI